MATDRRPLDAAEVAAALEAAARFNEEARAERAAHVDTRPATALEAVAAARRGARAARASLTAARSPTR